MRRVWREAVVAYFKTLSQCIYLEGRNKTVKCPVRTAGLRKENRNQNVQNMKEYQPRNKEVLPCRSVTKRIGLDVHFVFLSVLISWYVPGNFV
jgi:hypothetical protein